MTEIPSLIPNNDNYNDYNNDNIALIIIVIPLSSHLDQ